MRWRKSLYRSPAPKYVKRSVIKSLCEYNSVLIETGTFKGQFIINLHRHFSKCITIEPIKEYYEIAKKNLKFLEHKVELFNEKSEDCFEDILQKLKNLQISEFLKRKKSKYVIKNDFKKNSARKQVKDIIKEILL